MAKIYFEKLSELVVSLDIQNQINSDIQIKHFFSGAALYANDVLCASWFLGGLAFKMQEVEAEKLIASGKAKPLKYFEKGHIKKGYVMFKKPELQNKTYWQKYFIKAVELVS